jgi:hypothetical protein
VAPSGSSGRACWGCGVFLHPPKLASGADVPKFKCNWCLAINEPAALFAMRTGSARAARLKSRHAVLGHVFQRWGGRVLVVGVVSITASIGWAQVAHLAPVVARDSGCAFVTIVAVTLFFTANVLFNYALCVTRHAGAVEAFPTPVAFREDGGAYTSGETGDGQNKRHAERAGDSVSRELAEEYGNKENSASIQRGVFAKCAPCVPCASAKPHGSHHCSTCRSCVVGMDHHCPFLGNCVGADTMRHFLLFTAYVSAGNFFGVALCFYLSNVSREGSVSLRAFWVALGSKKHFGWGWADAYGQVEAGAGVFGSSWLSCLVGPNPGSVTETIKAGSLRGFLSLATHTFYFAARGVSRIINVAFAESPDWVGWFCWQLMVGGLIAIATGLLLVVTVQGVAAGETHVESLKRKNSCTSRQDEYDNTKDSFGGGTGSTTTSHFRDEKLRLKASQFVKRKLSPFKTIERSCPVVFDCLDCVTCGCVTGSAGQPPWSKIGTFHLRTVFGSGPVVWWGVPLWVAPIGARNGGRFGKKGK